MIFAFKKLSGKVQTVLKKQIDVKFEHYIQLEQLRCEKQKIFGYYSIINFLSKIQRSPIQNERLWWLAFQLQEQQQIKQADGTFGKKKVIKADHLKTLNKMLEQNKYIEGDNISEADIIAYVKIKQVLQDIKGQGKINQWMKVVGNLVDPIMEDALKQFKPLIDAAAKPKAQEKPKQQQPKQQQQQQPKQQEKEKQQEQPKQQDKKKQQQEISPEYLKEFNSLKIVRTNFGQQILPVGDKKNVLITSALPYVNNVPHLGNIIGCVLSADAYARYSRLRGYNTLYVCGTDEYGTATEVKAIQEKLTPQEICDKYHKLHTDVYKWFDIDFDYFGRTSTPQHTKITQDIFNHLHPVHTVDRVKPQTYCVSCQMFLADRYVAGVCPNCNYEDARGDQCDGCGKLLDPVELKDPKCHICKTTPEIRTSNHIYINLPQIQKRLEKWIHETAEKGQWSQNSLSLSKAWLNMGLQERCITRDLKWGVPVPLEGFQNKVFYVWFDAPIGYLSITANFVNDWEKWWMNPEQVSLFQFMGKDNVPFHTVIFPSTLMGTGQNYTLLNTISTTEYLNYEGGKFSKSRGVGVFGDNAVDSGIPCEIFRYYLLVNRPEKSDTIFTWEDFGAKNNNELLPNLGNLVNRSLKFIYANYNQAIPKIDLNTLSNEDKEFITSFVNKFKTEYIMAFEKLEIKDAIKKAMELSSSVNKYLQDEKAWEKEQKANKRSDTILFVAANAIRLVSAAIEPFMPSIAAKINFTLGFSKRTERDDTLFHYILSQDPLNGLLTLVPQGQPINQPVPLFRSFTKDELDNWRTMYSGQGR